MTDDLKDARETLRAPRAEAVHLPDAAAGFDTRPEPLPDTRRAARPASRPPSFVRRLDANGLLGLIVAAGLGLGFAWWLFGYPMLRGTASFWWREDADITQYIAGFNAFVHEPWHWPLLRMHSLNAPEGTLATFMDTIPLYALFLKVVHPGKGYWNPYGLWIGLCFTLQGVGAWWICREAKVRNWVAMAALALLVAAFPALTGRIAHTSLMSQWLLLFGLALYVRSGRLERLAAAPWMVLVVGAFYINIYLFSMVSAIFLADVLRELARRRFGSIAARRALLPFVAAYVLLFASLWITMLPMPPGLGRAEWGYGFYSMNLLAPLNGGALLHFDHPVANDGQGEGANYLGVFLLVLAALVHRLRRRRDPAFWRRHGALFGVCVTLTVYAISNQGYLGNAHLYTLDLPEWTHDITSTFRSSGRFFWPVGYAIMVFAVLGVMRHMRTGAAMALLATVVALQFWDLQNHHARLSTTEQQAGPLVVDPMQWEAFLGPDIRALNYYPPYNCDGMPASDSLMPVMVFAVKHHYPLSTGYIARASKPCGRYQNDIARLPADTAVAFEKKAFPQQDAAQALMGPNATCADMGVVTLCRRRQHGLADQSR